METLNIALLFIISSLCITHAAKPWIQTRARGAENVTKLHFYIHDVRTGANATTYAVTHATISSTSAVNFGQIQVYDDPATAEPHLNSEVVARAQGLVTSADLEIRAATMSLNFFLKAGEFSGNTISLVGRNQVGNPERELTVVGGTGPFRFARGYALTSTYYNSAEYSVFEYTVYATFSFHGVDLWPEF